VHKSKGENAVSDNPIFLYAGEYESVEDATKRAKKELKKEIRADAREMERAVDEA
jgi:hypothetical protein